MLSNLSCASKDGEIYETINEADHDYEILDISHAHEGIKVPPLKLEPTNGHLQQPLSSTNVYDYTQCPAYVSFATTGIHGNGSNADTPSVSQTATSVPQDGQNEKLIA